MKRIFQRVPFPVLLLSAALFSACGGSSNDSASATAAMALVLQQAEAAANAPTKIFSYRYGEGNLVQGQQDLKRLRAAGIEILSIECRYPADGGGSIDPDFPPTTGPTDGIQIGEGSAISDYFVFEIKTKDIAAAQSQGLRHPLSERALRAQGIVPPCNLE